MADGVQVLNLHSEPDNRDNTTLRDAQLINGYWEKSPLGELWCKKRPGTVTAATIAAGQNGYGMFLWRANMYTIFGSTLYKNGVSVPGTLDTTGGVYQFSASLGATPKLFMMNGVKAYTYDGTTLTQVTDVNYPSLLAKGAVYLDATMYVFQFNDTINGSNLNDPTTWPTSNTIIAQIESDQAVALRKQLVYVVAFKQITVEFFYDAGNATGSPLSPVQGSKLDLGCMSEGSIQDVDGDMIFLTQTKSGSVGCAKIHHLQMEIIETGAVARLLQTADYSVVYSWQAKIAGVTFYIVTMKNSNLTLVYNLTHNIWSQWADANGNYMPFVACSRDNNQRVLLQHESNGKIYQLSNVYYNDDGVQFAMDLYTPNNDFGTRTKKTIINMRVVADQTNGSMLQFRYSEDDYQTWSSTQMVDLSQDSPLVLGGGTFRKRAYHFRHKANTPFRLKAVQLNILGGTV